MDNKNTVIEFNRGTDIKIAIQSVIEVAKSTQKNYEMVYNNWFKMTVTPATTLQYGLNLFFSKSMSHLNMGMRQMKANQSIYHNKMLGWNK